MYTREEVVLPLAARTATVTTESRSSGGASVLMLYVNATDETDTAEVTPSLLGVDALGNEYTVWTAAAAISATGKTVYAIGVGLDASALGGLTDAENVPVPPTYRWKFTVADADSLTYSACEALTG